ncbi:uncharacterized protein [Arachis hypogaea]|uniref:uncharacterized protein n=1 Tax=Arachis hypogaea TaxID=3818 RepID=UPI003B225BEF
MSEDKDGLWRFKGRIIVSDVGDLRQSILEKAHKSGFSIHPGSTKMYQDLKTMFWWLEMKNDVALHVSKCLTCHKVKIEHQRPAVTLQPLEIPQWKWESIAIDFVLGLPRTRTGERSLIGPEMVSETTEQIKRIWSRMLEAQSRQKSYDDRRRKPLEFEEGEHVFLKVTSTTGIGRSIKTKKLNPRYIGPFEILKRIGPVAYRIALPPYLSNLHDVFHVSQLPKYTFDSSHVLEPESVQVREDLTLPITPVRIDDTIIKRLRGKEVFLVKVAWSRAGIEEHTSEPESEMRKNYPHLFSGSS